MRSPTIEMGSLEGFSPPSAEIVASSDDLLSEILLRLPIKSLLRFKFVSKHWLSLIADPQFSRRRSHSPEPPTALFLRSPAARSSYENHLSFVPLDPSQTSAPIKFLTCTRHPPIVQSSHGLFFCRSSEFGSDPKWYVYNPTTKQLTTLPPLPGPCGHICWMTLAFDPSESHFYKVICIQFSAPSASGFCVQVYSSETRSWGRRAGPFESGYREPWFFLNFTGGVYWKGAMHWLSQAEHSLCFDVNKEAVGELPMPPAPEHHELRGIRYFGETVGHLHLVQFCEDFQGEFDVFEMEGDRSGWFVKFRVDLNGVAMAYPGHRILEFITSAAELPGLEGLEVEEEEEEDDISACRFGILCVVRGKREEDSFLVIHLAGEIIAYNFNTQSHWKICEADRPFEPYLLDLRHPKFDAFQYTESLSLV